jgi:hypothetical protein
MTPQLFHLYVKSFVEAFTSEETLQAEGIVKALTKSVNMNARERAFTKYKAFMDQHIGSAYISDEDLLKRHTEAFDACEREFGTLAAFGSADERNKTRQALDQDVGKEKDRYVEMNHLRVHAILKRYTLLVLLAALAFALDWVSDYLCDWWLESCRDLSVLLWWSYFMIGMFMVWVVVDIYLTKGSVVVAQGLAGLWADLVELAPKLYQQVRESLSQALVTPSASSASTSSTATATASATSSSRRNTKRD